MKVGLIGDRLTGKTTIFEAVSQQDTSVKAEPVYIKNIKVYDPKLETLSKMYNPTKTTYAELTLLDYNRSLDKGTELLGSPQLVSKYRELDSIVLVVGIIDSQDKVKKSIQSVIEELYLADTILIEAKVNRLKKGKFDKQELALYERLLQKLEALEPINEDEFNSTELKLLSSFQLLTLKNITVAINVTDNLVNENFNLDIPYKYMVLSAELEKEIAGLEGEDKKVFLREYNLDSPALDRLINMIYESMDLISFYTVGKDEVRAWTIKRNSDAVVAAGKIHSDIARGFIKASTVSYDDLLKAGSEDNAKKQGLLRDEGKEYIVQAGDIIHFKFNV